MAPKDSYGGSKVARIKSLESRVGEPSLKLMHEPVVDCASVSKSRRSLDEATMLAIDVE